MHIHWFKIQSHIPADTEMLEEFDPAGGILAPRLLITNFALV
jgi:hypothetical protein